MTMIVKSETHCPPWCSGHDVYENPTSHPEMPGATRHLAGGTGAYLDEMRNPHGDYVTRPAGGHYTLYMAKNETENRASCADTVEMTCSTRPDGTDQVTLALTTGEARVLAARLLDYANRMDCW